MPLLSRPRTFVRRQPRPVALPCPRRSGMDPEGGRGGLKPGRNGGEEGRTGPFSIWTTQNERRFRPRAGCKPGHFIPAGLEAVPGRIWSNRTRPKEFSSSRWMENGWYLRRGKVTCEAVTLLEEVTESMPRENRGMQCREIAVVDLLRVFFGLIV